MLKPIDCRKISDQHNRPVIISAATASEAYVELMKKPIGGYADDQSFQRAYRAELKMAHESIFPNYVFSHKQQELVSKPEAQPDVQKQEAKNE